jgi:hypothetical protein
MSDPGKERREAALAVAKREAAVAKREADIETALGMLANAVGRQRLDLLSREPYGLSLH